MKKILILCVSLKGSTERQTRIQQQLISLQKHTPDIIVDFTFFDAVYGKKLAPEYLTFLNLSRQFAGQCEHELGASEFGCFLSHMILWQRLAQGNYSHYDRVIIIEDDVLFNLNKINEKLLSILETNPPFAFLGGHTEPSRRRIRGYTSQDQLYFQQTGPKDLYTSTYAYSLTASTAQKFISKLIKRLSFIDDWKYLLSGSISIPFYFCFEHDDEMESSIAGDRQQLMKKGNRFKKNFNKMKNDLISRIISLFIFKKIIRLSFFLQSDQFRKNN